MFWSSTKTKDFDLKDGMGKGGGGRGGEFVSLFQPLRHFSSPDDVNEREKREHHLIRQCFSTFWASSPGRAQFYDLKSQ